MTLDGFRDDCCRLLEQHLITATDAGPAPRLREAMRYSLLGGGKRLRPLLVRAAAESLGLSDERWLYPAAALEMIHCYSLIHDDLPAMDNDDLRRGRPTTHRAFDEATAILAGDALQSLAFEHLTKTPDVSAENRLMMVRLLAGGAGHTGMAGGQMLDLQAEGGQQAEPDLASIHRLKTGALIETAVQLGALCAKRPETDVLERLSDYGRALGLAFQITDDILDETADTETLGKPQGSDTARDKLTYVRLLGLAGAKHEARQQIDRAHRALDTLDLPHESPLRNLADYVLQRDH